MTHHDITNTDTTFWRGNARYAISYGCGMANSLRSPHDTSPPATPSPQEDDQHPFVDQGAKILARWETYMNKRLDTSFCYGR